MAPREPRCVVTLAEDQFGPYQSTLSTEKSLDLLRRSCAIPEAVELALPREGESPESVRPGFCCAYEAYFSGAGLSFPIPEALILYLYQLGIAFPQALPNFIRLVLCALTVAEETGFAFGVPKLMELFSVRISKTSGTFAIYPNTNRNLVFGFPEKDSGWMDRYFFFRITKSSVGDMHEFIGHKWAATCESQTRLDDLTRFEDFYRVAVEASSKWN